MRRLNTRWWVLLLVALALGLALAACGGDDKKDEGDSNQPLPDQQLVPEPADETAEADAISASVATPFAPLPELEFADAVALARADLATRLDVRPGEIEALSPESEIMLGQPEVCPPLPEADYDLSFVYLQHKRFIYPYQVVQTGSDLAVDACEDVFVDEDVLYIPTPDSRVAISEIVVTDLAERGVDTEQGEFQLIREMTWTDDRLGCPIRPGQDVPTTTVTGGFMMLYEAEGITYEYHTDKTGEQIVYCEPPPGYATPEDFISALQEEDLFVVQIIEDEDALVEGLTGDGVLVALTEQGYLLGVFGFASAEQTRAAATLITDPAVWRAFVSDRVLIVLYDTDPDAYSLLLRHSEEVELPAQRDEPTDEGT